MKVAILAAGERGGIEAGEHRQGLQDDRRLAVGAAREHAPAAIVVALRRRDLVAETGKVLQRHPAAIAVHPGHDALGDLAFVESLAHGFQRLLAVRALLGGGEPLQEQRQVRLLQAIPLARRPALRPVDGARTVPVPERRAHELVGKRRAPVEHEAFPGVADGRRRDIGERPCAEARQRRQPGIGRRRHDGAWRAERHVALVPLQIGLKRDALAPCADAADRPDLVGPGLPHEDRRHAAKIAHVGLDDVAGEPRRHAGIDRRAATLQHVGGDHRHQRMTGDHRIVLADERRPHGFRRRKDVRHRRSVVAHAAGGVVDGLVHGRQAFSPRR